MLRVWFVATQDVRTLDISGSKFRRLWVEDACMTRDGTCIAASMISETVEVWSLPDARRLAEAKIPRETNGAPIGKVTCVTWVGASGSTAAGTARGLVAIQVPDSARTRQLFQAHAGQIHAIDARPGMQQFVTGGRDSLLRIWELGSIEPLHVLRADGGEVLTARYSPDGRSLASGSAEGEIRIWDADRGALLATLSGHRGPVRRVAYSRDGAWLASASYDGTVRLWDARRTAAIAILLDTGRRMDAVDFSPDGTRLAAGGADGIVRILDPVARREVARFHGHDGRICWLGFSSQGSLVSTALDGTIRIWEPEPEPRPTVPSSRP
jgi:WD40 repeat protein